MSALVTNTVGNDKGESFDLIQNRIESLSSKMDKLIHIQEKVLYRLDGMSHDIDDIEKDMENLKVDKEEIHLPPRVMNHTQVMGKEVKKICQEMSTIMSAVNQRSEQQAQKLEGMEKLVLSMQQVIGFIGETVKSSKIMELILKGPTSRKGSKPKENKGKQAIKRKSSADTLTKKQDKKTTSNKSSKGKQQITPACEPSTPQPSHKIKLHGPNLFFASRKCGYFKTTSNTSSKGNLQITPACEPCTPQPSHKIKLHGPKHFLASRKCGYFMKDHKSNDGAEKPCLSPKSQKAQKRMKPPDTTDNILLKKQVLLLQEVQKLNWENSEKTAHQLTPGSLDSQGVENHEDVEASSKEEVTKTIPEGEPVVTEQEPKPDEDAEKEEEEKEEKLKVPEKKKEEEASTAEEVVKPPEQPTARDSEKEPTPARPDASPVEPDPAEESSSTCARSFVTEEHIVVEENPTDHEKVEEKREDNKESDPKLESEGWAVFKADGVEFQFDLKQRLEMEKKENVAEKKEDGNIEQFFIDNTPPPAAPFNHRIVSAKPNQISNFYTISWQEVLGGGRFGQVHKCVENSSGLTFAAKVIKVRSQKEKEMVKTEIHVMNTLDHANLIQLYAAYESRNDIILVLEYVSGGELFDRIIDENYTLMELDAVMFIRQICDGLQHMHRMYILHLDLKPENILCVSRVTNKIKIIDFGLARIYKPREKLRVNFGTPEFLAPEVINYDFASFNTDMWSLGVITYMLLSGLSPFLGDDDNETLNNILACQWNFEEQEFSDTSEEAKDFITRLLIVNKSWRMSASEALRHPWLSNTGLHHRLHTKKTMCKSRRSSCTLVTNS